MHSSLSCVAILAVASLQVATSVPVVQDFTSYFEMPHHLRNFGDSKFNQLKQRSRFTKLSDGNDFKVRKWSQNQNTNNLNGRASFVQPRGAFVKQTKMSPAMMMNDAASFRNQPIQFLQGRQGPPVVSVPPMLPPLPDITEQQLFGSVDIDALTAPYSLGENTREDQTPVQLPDTNEVENGTVTEYDHAYPDSNKVQDVISTHEIHTYTNQTNNVAINNLDLHRHHKIVNATTNYITNVARYNQPAILNSITYNNATEHQPYLYVVQSQTNLVNDNNTATNLPTLVSQQESTNQLPATFDTPIVQKYNYDGTLVQVAPVGRR